MLHAVIMKAKWGKRAVVAVSVGIVLAILGVVAAGVHSRSEIRRLDRAFSRLALGDTAEKAVELMGPPDRVRMGERLLAFSGVPQDSEHVAAPGDEKSFMQFCYTVKTFFLPITWVISFDWEMNVVSKMRLD